MSDVINVKVIEDVDGAVVLHYDAECEGVVVVTRHCRPDKPDAPRYVLNVTASSDKLQAKQLRGALCAIATTLLELDLVKGNCKSTCADILAVFPVQQILSSAGVEQAS